MQMRVAEDTMLGALSSAGKPVFAGIRHSVRTLAGKLETLSSQVSNTVLRTLAGKEGKPA